MKSLEKMTKRKVFVLGHFGAHNTGDDAMLLALLSGIKRNSPDLEFQIGTKHNYLPPGVVALGATSLPLRTFSVVKAILRSDILILAGGTHIHDSMTGMRFIRSLLSYVRVVAPLALARLLGLRVVATSIGVGPCHSRLTKLFAKWSCILPHFVSLRDEESLATLRECGMTRAIPVAFDVASLLERSPTVVRQPKLIGVNFVNIEEVAPSRRTSLEAIYTAISSELFRKMEQDSNLRIRAFVFRGGRLRSDMPITQKFLQPLMMKWPERVEIDDYNSDPQLVLNRMAECHSIVCSRYHALMLSFVAGCRTICTVYQPKVASLAKQIGLPTSRIVIPDKIAAETIVSGGLQETLMNTTSDEEPLHLEKLRKTALVHVLGSVESRPVKPVESAIGGAVS